jgi:hypothetical protein
LLLLVRVSEFDFIVFYWNILFYHLGQLDPEVYSKVLQEENVRLKTRVESLVKELVALENQRGGRSFFFNINPINLSFI